MKKLNHTGFGLIEILLVIIAITALTFTGYYIWNSKQTTEDTASSPTVSKTSKRVLKADPTKDWTPYSLLDISFKYPAAWVKNLCDQNSLLLGPTEGSAGRCQSDATPQVYVTITSGDKRSDNSLDPSIYPDAKTESVKVDGVTGEKQSGIMNTTQEMFVGPTNGTKTITYSFYKGGKTYIISYNQLPEFTDVSADFNTLATKTLKFN